MLLSSDEGNSRITVCVRARPLSEREKRLNSPTCLLFREGKTVCIYKKCTPGVDEEKAEEPSNRKAFTFDYAYDSDVRQVTLYEDLGVPVLQASFKGFNTCIFAYGQTGSGKSYSMMGPSGGRDVFVDPGIIPRMSKELFKMVEELKAANQRERDAARAEAIAEHAFPPELRISIVVSYMEIYQERLNCLLNGRCENLKAREHPVLGVYVEGLTEVEVDSEESIMRIMNGGNQSRHTAATNMNDRSSRSHAIFAIALVQKLKSKTKEGNVTSTELRAKINLVDLAGSERAKSTGAEGDTLREGANINKSLTVLGLVISALAQQSKGKTNSTSVKHVPYRDSTLTFILKESLGGNSKTFMLSTISPAAANYEETLSTLRYADRAKAIVTRAVINETAGDKKIRELENEVRLLREKMRHYEELVVRGEVKNSNLSLVTKDAANCFPYDMDLRNVVTDDINYPIAETPRQPQDAAVLQGKLHRAEELIKRLTQYEEHHEVLSSVRDLFCDMPTIKVNRNQSFLLNVDGVGDWVVEYFVVGSTYLGTEVGEIGTDERCIVVNGPQTAGIATRHCCFVKREDGRVFVRPLNNNLTYINGEREPVLEDTLLTSGDVVYLGDEFVGFKFTDPVAPQQVVRRYPVRNMDTAQLTPSSVHNSALTSCRRQVPISSHVSSGTDASNTAPVIPSLRLKEALKLSQTKNARVVTIYQDPMSQPGRSVSARYRSITPRVTHTAGRVVFTPGDEFTVVYQHTYLFLGASNSGKSAFRENLRKPDKWRSIFSNDKLCVQPTLGVDSSWVETSAENLTVRVNLVELGGNRCFSLLESLLPTRRVTYVLCFSLLEIPTLETLQPLLEFILCHTVSRDATVVLIGTHLDETFLNSRDLVKLFSSIEIEVNNYFRLLQSAQEMRPSIMGCFAVNNIGRTVFSPGIAKVKKFSGLLSWFGEQAIRRCRNDVDFPNAQIPERVLALKKKIQDLYHEGRWCLLSSEYKTIAKAVDSRYAASLEDLHRHTQLLMSWGVLHHHYRHLIMKKHVVVDVPWVFRALSILACCTPARRIDVNNESFCQVLPFVMQCKRMEDICGILPFDIFAVHEADVLSLLNMGILTLKTATVLFKGIMSEKNFGPSSVLNLLELLRSYDLLLMGSRLKFSAFTGDSMTTAVWVNSDVHDGKEKENDDCAFSVESHMNMNEGKEKNLSTLTQTVDISTNDTEEMFVVIPACFTCQPPSAFYLNLPSFLFGPFYRFTLNILPHNFFSRVVCRIAHYAEKMYLGPVSAHRVSVDFLIDIDKTNGNNMNSGICNGVKTSLKSSDMTYVAGNNRFWESMAWVISSNNSRALLRMVHHSLFVTFHSFEDDKEFYDGLCHVVRSLINESPGVRCEESILCAHEFIDEGEKANEIYGDKVYWRGVDENINSLEKIRQREQYALLTARGNTARGLGGVSLGEYSGNNNDDTGNIYDTEDDEYNDEIIPFVRDRTEYVDVKSSVERICAESFLTDEVLHEVTVTLHAMNDAQRNGNYKAQCMALDRLVDVLAHA